MKNETYALDANLALRMWVRRFLHAAAVLGGGSLVIPETARTMMVRRYWRLNRRRTEQTAVQLWGSTRASQDRDPSTRTAEEEIQLIKGRLEHGWAKAMGTWLREELRRNDSHWSDAPTTEATELAAAMIAQTRLLRGDAAGDDRYGGTGEDPQVIAEAIGAGVKWIGSANFGRGEERKKLNAWLSRASKEAGLTLTEAFILDPEEAVAELLGTLEDDKPAREESIRQRAHVAYAIARPEGEEGKFYAIGAQRMRNLIAGLKGGGLEHTARAVEGTCAKTGVWTDQDTRRLEKESEVVRIRAQPALRSDFRRMVLEANATRDVEQTLTSKAEEEAPPPPGARP